MVFTDSAGRAWTIYDYSIYAGKKHKHDLGDRGATYRGFAPVDGGARRHYMFGKDENQDPIPALMERQLSLSVLIWQDDAERYAEWLALGVTGPGGTTAPERVDPPEAQHIVFTKHPRR